MGAFTTPTRAMAAHDQPGEEPFGVAATSGVKRFQAAGVDGGRPHLNSVERNASIKAADKANCLELPACRQ